MFIRILGVFILSHCVNHHRENVEDEHVPEEVHYNNCVDDETNTLARWRCSIIFTDFTFHNIASLDEHSPRSNGTAIRFVIYEIDLQDPLTIIDILKYLSQNNTS